MPISLTFLSVLFAYTMTTLYEIAETLDLFDDWDQHYHYLVELGDCDTTIIKGVLALLIQLTDGRTAWQIQQLESMTSSTS